MTSYRRDGEDLPPGVEPVVEPVVTPRTSPGTWVDPVTGEVVAPTEAVATVQPHPTPYVAPVARPAVVDQTVPMGAVPPPVVAPAATVVPGPDVVATDQMVQRSFNAYSASQVVHGVGAILLLLFGAIAVARGGFSGPASDQVATVLGIELTTPVGLAVLAGGLLLAIAALTPSGRPFGGFVGVLLAVFGIVIIAAHQDLSADIRTDPALGWILLVIGVICVVAAFLPDEVRARRRQVLVR